LIQCFKMSRYSIKALKVIDEQIKRA